MKPMLFPALLILIISSQFLAASEANAQTIPQNIGGGFMNVSKQFVTGLANESGTSPKVQNAISSAIETISKLWDFTNSAKNTTVSTINAVSPVTIDQTTLGWIATGMVILAMVILAFKTLKWVLIITGIALFMIILLMILGIQVHA